MINKKPYLLIGILVLGLTIFKPVFNLLHHPYAPQLTAEAVWCVETEEKVLALTFDDGPNAEITPQILDALDRYHASATFFVVGINIADHTDVIKDLYQNGNEIGNHSWDHARLSFRRSRFIQGQIEETDQAIRGTGYEGNIPFRAPYGAKLLMLPQYLNQTGRMHVLWNVDSKDWGDPQAGQRSVDVLPDLSPGDIVLLHSSKQYDVVGWVEVILEEYSALGYRFITISELLSIAQGELPPSYTCVNDGYLGHLFNTFR